MKKTKKIKEIIRKGLCFIFLLCLVCIFTENAIAFNEVKYVRDISEHLLKPIDSVVSQSGDIFILDKTLARVFLFNANGQLKYGFGEKGSSSGEMYNPESIALNQEGQIIVTDTGNARVNVYSSEGHFLYQIGNEGQHKGEYEKPIGVTVDNSGYIFVADGHLKKIVKYSPRGVFLKEIKLDYHPSDITFDGQNALYVLSAELGSVRKYEEEELTKEMIFERDGRNLLKEASGITVDENSDIYFITLEDNSIYKFTQDEEMLFSFGSKGEGRGQFKRPAGIIYSKGNVYVPDTNNQRLQVFKVENEILNSISLNNFSLEDPIVEYKDSYYVSKFISDLSVSSNEEFYALSDSKGCIFKNSLDRKVLGLDIDNISDLLMPKAFAVKDSGEILIADTKKNRVQFLNEDGSYGYKFGVRGRNQSQFNNLEGIALHKDGYIYVADTDNHRIQIFNSDGIYLSSFGEKTTISGDGSAAPGTFWEPKTLEFDSQDNLYVLDYRNKRVQVFNDQGKYLSEISLKGLKNELQDPVDIAIDEQDYLYIADRGDHSIKIFNPEHGFVYKFGSEGRGPSYFPNLSAVDAFHNRIYVADYNVESVQVFEFNPSLDPRDDHIASDVIDENEIAQEELVEEELVEEMIPAEEESIVKVEDEVESSNEEAIQPVNENDPEKLFLSRITYALGYINLPQETKVLMLRKDLAQNGDFSDELLEKLVIESEDEIDDERLRIVVSIPKE